MSNNTHTGSNISMPLGWIEPAKRTPMQQDLHLATMRAMPVFAAPGSAFIKPEVGTKILLPGLWNHARVVDRFGKPFTGVHQITGSCVGAAGGNVLTTLSMIEVLTSNEPELISMPYWLWLYGLSRRYAGMNGEGEGSFGSTFAKAWSQDGSPDMYDTNLALPQPKSTNDGWVWGQQLEMDWSDGNVSRPEVKKEGVKHKGTATPAMSAEAVRDFILNGYPCTRASMRFVNPNSASVKNGALIGTHNGRGGHQEGWLGYWNHPQNGELIWEQNQWGLNTYGTDPGGGPLGGCWITMATCQSMIDEPDSEVFAFSQYEGYPAQPNLYDWIKNSPIG